MTRKSIFRWLIVAVAVAFVSAAAAEEIAKRGTSSYLPVVDKEEFKSTMSRLKGEKAVVQKKHQALLDERRSWSFVVAQLEGIPALLIDFATTLTSATGSDVALQTPAQRGRPDGGYGGLWLRLAEGFAVSVQQFR